MSASNPSWFPDALATPADVEALRPDLPLDARISQIIIREILAAHHAPGSWLREVEVAQRLGVSRPVVREAFRHAYRAGFVEIQPWRGARVVQLSLLETRRLLDLLEANFGVVGEIAAESFPPSEHGRLDALLAELDVAVAVGGVNERVRLSFAIAKMLSRHGGSPTAHDVLMRVGSLVLWQHRYLEPDDRDVARRSSAMVRALIDAVKARDAETAGACARSVVRITKSTLMALMPQVQKKAVSVEESD
jgi:DNA-binding GntR family transcriptional regulator